MATSEELFNMLGNETRRMILELLAEKPRYTTELSDMLDIGQKAINEHLKIMRDLGIIELYVEKQLRGSPRKYFKILDSFKMEFTVSPNFFDIDIADRKVDQEAILERFPEFVEYQKRVENSCKIARMEELRQIVSGLSAELERISEAKMYIENLISQVRGQCTSIMESMELDEQEKKVLFEIVSSGGKSTLYIIAQKYRIEPEEVKKSLLSLKEKNVVRV
jgi:ArsR family transcriptional regulator